MRVALDRIRPNPFRDTERYPYDEAKIAALRESIRETGFWDNILARPDPADDGFFESAYGHHRLKALELELGPSGEIGLESRQLTDEQMLKILARENMQQWGSSAAIEMETIRAVVLAHATGKITLAPPPPTTRPSALRHAPSFQLGADPGTPQDHPYTASTIAPFLGWTDDKVYDVLNALELVESGTLSEADYLGLSTAQAKAVTARARQAREEALTAAKREEARQQAATAEAQEARRAAEEARRQEEEQRRAAAEARDEKLRQQAREQEEKARREWEAARQRQAELERKQREAQENAARLRQDAAASAGAAARDAGNRLRQGESIRQVQHHPSPAPQQSPPPGIVPLPFPMDAKAREAAGVLRRLLRESDVATLLITILANQAASSPDGRGELANALLTLAQDAESWREKVMSVDAVPVG